MRADWTRVIWIEVYSDTMRLAIEQVGKGGLPPLALPDPNTDRREQASGGKPPFPTCSILAGLLTK